MIGGGVGGCSIAYHLAKLGLGDVVLVEQFDLTYGSTWHSAGLVGQLRSSVSLTRMMMYSVELYAALRRETGKDPGWHELGGITSRPRRRGSRRSSARPAGPRRSACRSTSSARPRRRSASR